MTDSLLDFSQFSLEPASDVSSPETSFHNKTAISYRYINPKTVLSVTEKRVRIFIDPSKPFQGNAYSKKYFGKRVAYVTRTSMMTAANHQNRLFQRLVFENKTIQKSDFRVLGGLVILGDNIQTNNFQQKRALSGCKGEISISLVKGGHSGSKLINLMRCMSNMRCLNLKLEDSNQIPSKKRLFGRLKHLEKFSIRFRQTWYLKNYSFNKEKSSFGDYHNNAALFLLCLIKSAKNLKSFRADFNQHYLGAEPLAYLLLFLEHYNVSKWYIKGIVDCDFANIVDGTIKLDHKRFPFLKTRNPSIVIRKIDCFALYRMNHILYYYDEPNYPEDDCGGCEYSPLTLSQMTKLTAMRKRVLDITVIGTGVDNGLKTLKLNIRWLLSHFCSLETFYMNFIESELTLDEKICKRIESQEKLRSKLDYFDYGPYYSFSGKPSSTDFETGIEGEELYQKYTDEFSWASSLQEVVLGVSNVQDPYCYTDVDIPVLGSLLRILKNNSAKPRSLNFYYVSTLYGNNHGVSYRHKSKVYTLPNLLKNWDSLEELELTIDRHSLKEIGVILNSLKELKSLKLNHLEFGYRDFKGEDWPYEIDYNTELNLGNPARLALLQLIIRPATGPVKWAERFISYVRKLRNLEVLRILEFQETEMEMETKISIQTLSNLLGSISHLENLKELVIHTKVEKSEEYSQLEEIKKLIGDMIKSRAKLELIDIQEFEDNSIKSILYRK